MVKSHSLHKYIIIIGIIVLGLSFSTTFAQNSTIVAQACTSKELSQQLVDLLTWILGMLSWLWIPIAIFAGKLMNNGFVYGEFFNLDKVLYFLRNMSRTFANFLVVALIIGELIKQFGAGGIDQGKMMKYILRMGGGIFLANLSWFLIGATVDISTIITTTIGSLPSTYVAQNTTSKDVMLNAIRANKKQEKQTINFNSKQCDTSQTITPSDKNTTGQPEKTEQEILDMILPTESSVSGPLMYLGIGVLKVQDYLNTSNIPKDDAMYALFVIGTRIGITILFVIALVVLVIINIFRIVAIWFFVAFAPLLILLQFADKEKSYQTGLLKDFSIPNIIKAIFAPVIAVGLMSIGLIVVVVMQGFLQHTDNIQLDDINMKIDPDTKTSSIGANGIFETTMAGDILGKDDGNLVKNTFSNILLIIFTLFILYGVVQALSSFLKDDIGGTFIKQAVDLGSKALSMMPVPLPGGGSASISAVGKAMGSRIKKFEDKFDSKNNSQDNALQNKMNEYFGLPGEINYTLLQPLRKYTEKISKQNYFSEPDFNEFFTHYDPIKNFYKQDNQKKMKNSLSNMKGISDNFETFLKKASQSSDIKSKYPGIKLGEWKKQDGTEHTVDTYIQENFYKDKNTKNTEFFKDIYEKLGGDKTKLNSDGSNFWSKEFKRKE